MVEGCDDLYEQNKITTILDMTYGTGSMLSAANDYIKRLNPGARVKLFGQEINPESYAICLAAKPKKTCPSYVYSLNLHHD